MKRLFVLIFLLLFALMAFEVVLPPKKVNAGFHATALKARWDGYWLHFPFSVFLNPNGKDVTRNRYYKKSIKYYVKGKQAPAKRKWDVYYSAIRLKRNFNVAVDYLLWKHFGVQNSIRAIRLIDCLFGALLFTFLAIGIGRNLGWLTALPLVYYIWVDNVNVLRNLVNKVLRHGISTIIGFCLALFIHFGVLSLHFQSASASTDYLKTHLAKRSHAGNFDYTKLDAFHTNVSGLANSHQAGFSRVLKRQAKVFFLPGIQIKSLEWVLSATLLLLIITHFFFKVELFQKREITALLLLLLISLPTYYVNLFIFKSHAVIHPNKEWIDIPFSLIFYLLIGVVVQQIIYKVLEVTNFDTRTLVSGFK